MLHTTPSDFFAALGMPLRLMQASIASLRMPHQQVMSKHQASEEKYDIGDFAEMTRTFTRYDLLSFCFVTGDYNPVHWNEAFARQTPFRGMIAHGMFVGSLFSALFGDELPGEGAIYMSQRLDFKAPVRVGDTVVSRVELVELLPKNGARFTCVARVGDTVVIEGEAHLKLPKIVPHH